jgi:class 3 adenylate cyclase
MADLEALTRIDSQGTGVPGQYSWRYALPEKKLLRLGSDATYCDWVVPEDRMISRYHATLEWTGTALTVTRRGVIKPTFPNPPQNPIWFNNKPVETCTVRPGEWFVIGQTRFTLRGDSEQVAQTRSQGAAERQVEDVLEGHFLARDAAPIPSLIRAVTSEPVLFRQVLKVVLDTLPRAIYAAVVRIHIDISVDDQRMTVVEQNVRSPNNGATSEFVPSRKLTHRAIVEKRRSCLHCWPSPAAQIEVTDMTLVDVQIAGTTPWAICTPFQDGSKYALYIAGHAVGEWNRLDKETQDKMIHDLMQFLHVAELLVGVVETTLRVSRLTQQNKVIRRAWPHSLWKYLDDPDELERMLAPKEQEITTLFCDLRNYSLFASQNASQLLQAQKEVSTALSTMSGAITDRDGVVAGFRGDAVVGFWGWPKGHDKQVEMAARAAIYIAGRLDDWSQGGRCGLGLTHGVAVAGRLGAHDLAVVDLYGPVVNLTFRLEAMTKAFGVPIIVSQEVAQQIAEADPQGREMRTRPLGKVRAKGFPDPLWAHELYSAQSPSIQDWQREEWAATVDLFTAGSWDEASAVLKGMFPDDPASRCLLRVMDRMKFQLPNDWDGSFAPPSPDGS